MGWVNFALFAHPTTHLLTYAEHSHTFFFPASWCVCVCGYTNDRRWVDKARQARAGCTKGDSTAKDVSFPTGTSGCKASVWYTRYKWAVEGVLLAIIRKIRAIVGEDGG